MGGAWRTISVALKADTAGYLGPLGTASAATRKLGSETDAATKKTGSSWMSLNKIVKVGAAGMVLAVGAFLAASISAASQFESKMSAIGAVTGATGGQLDQLRDKALQLGADTSFSAGEAAGAMEELAKAGVPVEGILNGAADATVALAAAGGVDLPVAAEIAANAMNQFGLSAEELPHIADLIAGSANASAIEVTDFGLSMSQAGAVAKLTGLSFDDTAVAITAMGNAGIKGSDAGTSLKTFLTRLVPVGEKATGMMRDLGIITEDGSNKFFDAQGNVKGMADISGVLATALEGQSKQQQIATLQTLFGSDAIRAAAVIAEEGRAGFQGLSEELGNISAADVAAARMDNLGGSVEQLKGSVETLLIKVGSNLTPFLRDAADAATGFVNTLGSGGGFMDPIIDGVQRLEPAWRGLADTAGNLITIIGEGASAIEPFAVGLAKVTAGAIIVGLNATATALAAITGFLADNKAAVDALVAGLVTLAVSSAIPAMVGLVETLYLKWLTFQGAVTGTAIMQGLSTIATGFATLATNASAGLSLIGGGFKTLATTIASPIGALAVLAAGVLTVQRGLSTAHDQAKATMDALKPKGYDERSLKSVNDYARSLDAAAVSANKADDKYNGWLNVVKGSAELLSPMENKVLDAAIATGDLAKAAEIAGGAADRMNAQYSEVARTVGLASAWDVGAWVTKLDLDPATMSAEELSAAIGDAKVAAEQGTPATDALGVSLATMANETSSATDQLKAFEDAMNAVLGIPKSLADAQRDWQQSIADTTTSLYKLKSTDPAAFAAGGASAFDLLTDSGRQTDAAMSGLVDQGYALAESLAKAGDSAGATEQLNATRQQVIDVGNAFGIPIGEIDKYLQKIGLTPAQIKTFVAMEGVDTAAAALQNIFPNELVMKVIANAVMTNADADLNSLASRTRIATVVAEAITGKAEYGLANVTDRQRVTQVILEALTNDATIDINTVAGQERLAMIVAQTLGVGAANAEIDTVTRDRVALFTAEVFTGNAEYGLQSVTDKGRVATIIAQALANDASINLDTVAGRERIARIIADTFGIETANAEIDNVTRDRIAMFTAQVNAGGAEGALNITGRDRIADVIAVAITGNADVDLATTAGRQRIADIVANAITGKAEYGLAGVTDKGRVAQIVAEALAQGADFDLNTVAGRKRLAYIIAQANAGEADRAIDAAARDRYAMITAAADTARANAMLDAAAQVRYAKVYEQYVADPRSAGDRAPKAFGRRWGGINSYASGGVNNITAAGVYRGDLIRFAEPETVKEAYIPFRGDAARSMAILAETASWFNAAVVPMAEGGVVPRSKERQAEYDASFLWNNNSSPNRGKPGAFQFEDGSWGLDAKKYYSRPAVATGGGGGGSKQMAMGQVTFKTTAMAAGGVVRTGASRTSSTSVHRNQSAMAGGGLIGYSPVPSGGGGGQTVINISMPAVSIYGNGDDSIRRIAADEFAPTMRREIRNVAKIMQEHDRAVRS